MPIPAAKILQIYKRRIYNGEHISATQVYGELSHSESEFTMTTIRLRTPEMKQFMTGVYEYAGSVIDDVFGICPWKTHRVKCIRSLKALSPEKLKEYNRLKAHNCKLSGRRWANWCL